MKKKILCLIMTAVMIVGTAMTVSADELTGPDDWTADFKNDKITSNISAADMSNRNVLPGDSIEYHVAISNSSTDDTDWYMTNEVFQSLETGSAATDGGYGYQLRYVDSSNKETSLYNSDTVGGDGEGLLQVSGSLKNYFYVGRLTPGQSGTVYLKVTFDGESQVNTYQDTLARLQMNFAVEKVAKGSTIERVNQVTNRGASNNTVVTTPVKTGDETRLLFLSVAALLSGLVLLGLGIYTMKRRQDSRKGE